MIFAGLKKMLPSAKGLLGINARNLDYIYTHNRRSCFPNIDDKLRCKSILSRHGIPTPKTLGIVDGPRALISWQAYLDGVSEFVIKPSRGFGGEGIMIVSSEGSVFSDANGPLSEESIEFHIMQILNGAFSIDNTSDTAFFEEKLTNDPTIAELISVEAGGVADIRLICQLHRPVMAMLRLPTRASAGKANLHQGGLGIGIDLATGRTNGGSSRNQIIYKHPETGIDLAGHTIPHWSEIMEHGSRISEIVGLGYIGIDFVCDANQGAIVLEVNARPGLNIQIANRAGLRSVLK